MSIIPQNSPDVIVIPLTQGKETVIDAIDADLAEFRWNASNQNGRFYAKRNSTRDPKTGRQFTIGLHRVILERVLDRALSKKEFVDHINNDPLDNRRENLRIATLAQNGMNRKLGSNSTSGYKGVTFDKAMGRWKAHIMINKKTIHLGYFMEIEEAAKAYADASAKYHGEFGRLE